jgi:DNA-binding CsgD family transcriptional regulator
LIEAASDLVLPLPDAGVLLDWGGTPFEVPGDMLEFLDAHGLGASGGPSPRLGRVLEDWVADCLAGRAELRAGWYYALYPEEAPGIACALGIWRTGHSWLLRSTETPERARAVMLLRDLTARQRHIAALVSEGLDNEEIGARLGISAGTVRTQLHRAFERTGLANRTALARAYLAQWLPR